MPALFSNLRQVLVVSSPPAFHLRDPQLAVPTDARYLRALRLAAFSVRCLPVHDPQTEAPLPATMAFRSP